MGTASAAAPGTMGTLVRHHHDQVCPQHSHLYTSSHAVHIAAVSCMAIRSLRGGSSPAPGTGGITHPPASVQPHSSCSSPTEHPNGPPCPWVSCERIHQAAAPLSSGCARQRRRICAVMHHQLTARYYKTLPTGLKRLEKPRSGFSWSHAQRPVSLTLEKNASL